MSGTFKLHSISEYGGPILMKHELKYSLCAVEYTWTISELIQLLYCLFKKSKQSINKLFLQSNLTVFLKIIHENRYYSRIVGLDREKQQSKLQIKILILCLKIAINA